MRKEVKIKGMQEQKEKEGRTHNLGYRDRHEDNDKHRGIIS